MLDPNFFNTFFVFPILNLLVAFYHLFLQIRLPGAFGFAIIALTVLVRIILQPFFHKQMETARKMQDLKPHLDRLSQKHKEDKKRLQQEQLKLYQEAGINPASGCLFMIIQIPVFIALYNAFNVFLANGVDGKTITAINKALYLPFLKIQTIDPLFFGLNLALTPQKSGLWYYYLVPIITAFLQYLQVQVSQPKVDRPLVETPKPEKTEEEGQKKETSTTEDFQKAMNTQMKYLFPVLIGWFSFSLPVGLSLYWNIFSLFSIIQYQQLKSKAKISN